MKAKLQRDNQTLVEECRKGDKEALNLFYLRFAPRMLSVVRRYIRDEKDAEDVLHDGFIVGLTRLDTLRDADKVDLWLATIMKNLSLQYLQAQDMATIIRDIPDVEETPEMPDILDMEILESLMEKLPAGYRKVFRLAILENKSHKEIGKLLGIAPNSSSSQLFHARLMMRRLINEYRHQLGLGVVLLLGLLSTLYLRKQNSHDLQVPEMLIANVRDSGARDVTDTGSGSEEKVIQQKPASAEKTTISSASKEPEPIPIPTPTEEETPVTADSIVEKDEEPPGAEDTDTAHAKRKIDKDITDNHNTDNHNIVAKRKSSGGWALNVGADTWMLGSDFFKNYDSWNGSTGDIINPPSPGGSDDSGEKEDMRQAKRRAGGYMDYRYVNHGYSIPISFSITASKRLDNVFSMETGLKYTFLSSTFETSSTQSRCHWHYLGIPLKVNIRLCSARRVKLYGGIGGVVHIPISSEADVTTAMPTPDLRPGRFGSPVMLSVSGNLGVSLKLSGKVDVFLEPTFQYFFNQEEYTVPNIWTDNDIVFSLPVGLRVNL